jgi:hypothetical protein
MNKFHFPAWANTIRIPLFIGLLGGGGYVATVFALGASPKTTDIGYAPVQPIAYSHALHAGKLGIDCRYCHQGVERSSSASLPSSQTCMNCHEKIRAQSPLLLPLRESVATGKPIEWIRVHRLPDYVYFNHSAHVTRGVGCVSCHGRVDTMERVYQHAELSMGWCLECHRSPEKNLRPQEFVTKMDWQSPEDPLVLGARLRKENNINPSTDCSTCHR